MVLENTELGRDQEPRPREAASPIEVHLRKGEMEYRLLAEGVPDMIAYLSSELEYCFVNRNYAHWFGYIPDKLIGKQPKDFLSEESYAAARPYMEAALQGEPQYYEIKALTIDGVSRWLSVRYIPHIDDRGNTDGFYAVIQDIEESKKNLEAIEASERDYRTVVENASDGIFILQDRSVKFPNPKMTQLTGFTAAELADIPFGTLVHREDEEPLKLYLEALAEGGEPPPITIKMINKFKELKWIQISSVPVPWKGEMASLIFVREVTEQKTLEVQLRRSQKMEAIGVLAGGIAHDFNNILMIITASAEMMGLDEPGKEHPKQLNNILSACSRAQDLIRQVLTFSRQAYQDKIPMQLKLLVKETVHFLKASLPTTIEIRTNIRHGTGNVLGDPTQIHQVMMNLCTNAAHAMRDHGGILSMEVEEVDFNGRAVSRHERSEPGTHVMLTVSDTGHGIEPRILDKIFDPFFTSKPPGEGTGLGLSVAYGIIKEHGGEILVESEIGRGSTFKVVLPRFSGGADEDHAGSIPHLSHGREHILFVDDEAVIADLAKDSLESLGYRVTVAGNGKAALELFAASPSSFDMVVTDQTMPSMTGVKLAEEIAKLRPELPIVLCTGFTEIVSEEDARELGIRAYLRKPVSIYSLAETIRGLLDG